MTDHPIIAELSRRLAAEPFQPFAIVLADGRRLEVPQPEHVTITHRFRRIEWQAAQPEVRIVEVNPHRLAAIEPLNP